MNIAIYSAIFLAALVALSIVGRMVRKQNGEDTVPSQLSSTQQTQESQEPQEPSSTAEDDGEECCGEHEVCEKGRIKRALRTDIEYFDDEELDRFRGTMPDEYDDEAVEEFREVLYTMHPSEVLGWVAIPFSRGSSCLRDQT